MLFQVLGPLRLVEHGHEIPSGVRVAARYFPRCSCIRARSSRWAGWWKPCGVAICRSLRVSRCRATFRARGARCAARWNTAGGEKLVVVGSAWSAGRQREFAELQEVISAAVGGRGELVVVAGEAGIGKTCRVQSWVRPVMAATSRSSPTCSPTNSRF